MKVRTIRITEDIEKGIAYVAKVEKLEAAQSLRKLARKGFESYVAEAYKHGKVTLREACELLSLSPLEVIELLLEKGVKGNIRAEDVLASLESCSPPLPPAT